MEDDEMRSDIIEFDATGYKETLIHVEIVKNTSKYYKSLPWKYIETKEYRFNCRYCEKSFAKQYVLKRHVATHTGEKTFKCTQCEMAFIQKSDLNRHITTHSEERPFKCEVPGCVKSFRTVKNLRNHMVNSQHLELKYNCETCGEICKSKQLFEDHIEMHKKYRQIRDQAKLKFDKYRVHRNPSYDKSVADKYIRNTPAKFIHPIQPTQKEAERMIIENKTTKETVKDDEDDAYYEFVDENEFLIKEHETFETLDKSEELDKFTDFEINFELKEEPEEEPSCVIETGNYRFETDLIKKEEDDY